MNLVLGQGRDPLSPSPVALRQGPGQGQDEGGGAADQGQSLEEGDLYQKRSAKDRQSTDPSLGKEKGNGQAPEIIENQSEHEVVPQVVGVGVTHRVVEGDLDLWGEEGALVFPPVGGAEPPVEGAEPPVEGVAPPAGEAEPPAEGAVPPAAEVALPAEEEDQDLL